MEHPQPAFDFLTSLPMKDATLDESVFVDWYAYEGVDAEKEDNIEDHPEIWDVWDVPNELIELSTDDHVALQPFSGKVNLNAMAIGLGLEDVKYNPEKYGGLVYNPAECDATVLVFWCGILFAVGETGESTVDALEQTLSRIEDLGLDEDAEFDDDMQTGCVSDFI